MPSRVAVAHFSGGTQIIAIDGQADDRAVGLRLIEMADTLDGTEKLFRGAKGQG